MDTVLRVAVCDDDSMERAVLQKHIMECGVPAACTLFASAEELLEEYYAGRFDLVIMDIYMMGMDGFETFEHIRSICDTPILFITADDDQDMQQRARTIGAQGCLIKPFAPELLRESVHRYAHC